MIADLAVRYWRWRQVRAWARHVKRLRKMRVVPLAPNPRAIVYRKWNVPE